MPLYEFQNDEHSVTCCVHFPADARPDTITLTRRTVPSRVSICVGAQPPTMSDKLAAGYKHLEDTGKLAARGKAALSTATIKRAIAMPETLDAMLQRVRADSEAAVGQLLAEG